MSRTRKVTLAYPLEHDGKSYKADQTVELPDELAIELVAYGRARKPEAEKKTASSNKES